MPRHLWTEAFPPRAGTSFPALAGSPQLPSLTQFLLLSDVAEDTLPSGCEEADGRRLTGADCLPWHATPRGAHYLAVLWTSGISLAARRGTRRSRADANAVRLLAFAGTRQPHLRRAARPRVVFSFPIPFYHTRAVGGRRSQSLALLNRAGAGSMLSSRLPLLPHQPTDSAHYYFLATVHIMPRHPIFSPRVLFRFPTNFRTGLPAYFGR